VGKYPAGEHQYPASTSRPSTNTQHQHQYSASKSSISINTQHQYPADEHQITHAHDCVCFPNLEK
jgi:hypothetical protein